MEFLTTAALSGSWRQYHYINHLAIKDATVYCENVVQSIYFWKAFKHFFRTQVEIKKFLPANQDIWNNMDKYYESDDKYDLFKEYLNVDLYSEHQLVYSIIDSDVHKKGIAYDSKRNIINNINGVDLGDSRNFKNEHEIIEKVTNLANADMYLGSNCSWSNIAPYFDTNVVLLSEPYVTN